MMLRSSLLFLIVPFGFAAAFTPQAPVNSSLERKRSDMKPFRSFYTVPGSRNTRSLFEEALDHDMSLSMSMSMSMSLGYSGKPASMPSFPVSASPNLAPAGSPSATNLPTDTSDSFPSTGTTPSPTTFGTTNPPAASSPVAPVIPAPSPVAPVIPAPVAPLAPVIAAPVVPVAPVPTAPVVPVTPVTVAPATSSSPAVMTSAPGASPVTLAPSAAPSPSLEDTEAIGIYECTDQGVILAGTIGSDTAAINLTVAYAAEVNGTEVSPEVLAKIEAALLQAAIEAALECDTNIRNRLLRQNERNLLASTDTLGSCNATVTGASCFVMETDLAFVLNKDVNPQHAAYLAYLALQEGMTNDKFAESIDELHKLVYLAPLPLSPLPIRLSHLIHWEKTLIDVATEPRTGRLALVLRCLQVGFLS